MPGVTGVGARVLDTLGMTAEAGDGQGGRG